MSRATFVAFTAVLFSVAAQASYICNPGDTCISQTITGTISSGTDSGDGTYDDANYFNIGGGSTLHDTLTITLNYDLTSIQNGGGGNYFYTDGVGYGINSEGPTNPADYLMTVTLNSQPPMTVDDSVSFENASQGYQDEFYNEFFSQVYGSSNTFTSINARNVNPNYSIWDTGSNAQLMEIFNDPSSTVKFLAGTQKTGSDTLYLTGVQDVAGTPEPNTWLSLATGLGGLALFKFRPGKSRG
jgi:hypothetical protein